MAKQGQTLINAIIKTTKYITTGTSNGINGTIIEHVI